MLPFDTATTINDYNTRETLWSSLRNRERYAFIHIFIYILSSCVRGIKVLKLTCQSWVNASTGTFRSGTSAAAAPTTTTTAN
jgi:hypothetical protein